MSENIEVLSDQGSSLHSYSSVDEEEDEEENITVIDSNEPIENDEENEEDEEEDEEESEYDDTEQLPENVPHTKERHGTTTTAVPKVTVTKHSVRNTVRTTLLEKRNNRTMTLLGPGTIIHGVTADKPPDRIDVTYLPYLNSNDPNKMDDLYILITKALTERGLI